MSDSTLLLQGARSIPDLTKRPFVEVAVDAGAVTLLSGNNTGVLGTSRVTPHHEEPASPSEASGEVSSLSAVSLAAAALPPPATSAARLYHAAPASAGKRRRSGKGSASYAAMEDDGWGVDDDADVGGGGPDALASAPTGKSPKTWFTATEDEIILREVLAGGAKPEWNLVAAQLQGRTGKQVRERYINHLDPTIKRGPFLAFEDRVIWALHAAVGARWAEIAKSLPGRTENSVKNRFYAAARKSENACRSRKTLDALPDNTLPRLIAGVDALSADEMRFYGSGEAAAELVPLSGASAASLGQGGAAGAAGGLAAAALRAGVPGPAAAGAAGSIVPFVTPAAGSRRRRVMPLSASPEDAEAAAAAADRTLLASAADAGARILDADVGDGGSGGGGRRDSEDGMSASAASGAQGPPGGAESVQRRRRRPAGAATPLPLRRRRASGGPASSAPGASHAPMLPPSSPFSFAGAGVARHLMVVDDEDSSGEDAPGEGRAGALSTGPGRPGTALATGGDSAEGGLAAAGAFPISAAARGGATGPPAVAAASTDVTAAATHAEALAGLAGMCMAVPPSPHLIAVSAANPAAAALAGGPVEGPLAGAAMAGADGSSSRGLAPASVVARMAAPRSVGGPAGASAVSPSAHALAASVFVGRVGTPRSWLATAQALPPLVGRGGSIVAAVAASAGRLLHTPSPQALLLPHLSRASAAVPTAAAGGPSHLLLAAGASGAAVSPALLQAPAAPAAPLPFDAAAVAAATRARRLTASGASAVGGFADLSAPHPSSSSAPSPPAGCMRPRALSAFSASDVEASPLLHPSASPADGSLPPPLFAGTARVGAGVFGLGVALEPRSAWVARAGPFARILSSGGGSTSAGGAASPTSRARLDSLIVAEAEGAEALAAMLLHGGSGGGPAECEGSALSYGSEEGGSPVVPPHALAVPQTLPLPSTGAVSAAADASAQGAPAAALVPCESSAAPPPQRANACPAAAGERTRAGPGRAIALAQALATPPSHHPEGAGALPSKSLA